ncbi:recombinase family protein [Mucilaginibacter sp. UYCu711]|uniref:recombinase family protein n=1 Tax=Mucilaginibacter sp. UYCu711 TaxID=3156339 RepID=UPI003D1F2EAB
MTSAYLYVRVSTDEQKRKGYSLPEQEDRLLRHCEFNNIEVKGIFREDYSAKNFKRPEWNKLLTVVKNRKKKDRENILFIKWDRFSRNIEFAYQMIGILRTINVQAMAIDQPIDFGIPESTVMLAVYLSIPEAENGRRALNTSGGMRRARKEGRWMGAAPKGYQNLVYPDGRKYIAPKHPEAALMKWVFEELSKGILVAEQVRKIACQRGLKCERNNFWKLIRNPMYAGIIVVPPFENEEMQFVKAQHEALISQTLFYEVQNMLNGNKRPIATKIVSKDMLPLRGFLECPDCNRMLTGSASKGRHERYYYYHCTGTTCKCRFKAETVNQYFEDELIKFNLASGVGELFKMVVMDECRSTSRDDLDERKVISTKIEEQELNLSKARKRLLKEEIDADDFKAIKAECNDELRMLESRLADLPAKSNELKSIELLLDVVIERYSNILQHYKNQAVEEKRKIIGSMYPKNLCFDGTQHRTAYLSEPLSLILLINSNLQGKKRGEKLSFYNLSPQVARRGIEPLFLE